MSWCPDRIGAEHVLFHILNSFEPFTSQKHKEKRQKFVRRAVINIYFDNKRKLSTDSVMKDKAKTLKKILFQKYKICFPEAATETCSGK